MNKNNSNYWETLLEEAHKNNINHFLIAAIIEKNGSILLLKHEHYELPKTELKTDESIVEGLERLLHEKLGTTLGHIKEYLGYTDQPMHGSLARQFNFEVTIQAPSKEHHWLSSKERQTNPLESLSKNILESHDLNKKLKFS